MFGIVSVRQELLEKDVMIMGEVDNENGKCESVKYRDRVSSKILSGKHTWAVAFPDLLISEILKFYNHKEIPKKIKRVMQLVLLLSPSKVAFIFNSLTSK